MTTPTTHASSDWSDKAFDNLCAMAKRLETNPLWLLQFMKNESNCESYAVCKSPSGNPIAVGLNQLLCQSPGPGEKSNLQNCGWSGTVAAYTALSPEDQLIYVEHYLTPHKGQLISLAACYCINFLPADESHDVDPTFVLVDSGARAAGDATPITFRRQGFYIPNVGLDRGGLLPAAPKSTSAPWGLPAGRKGYIRVDDLGNAVLRACVGARWTELAGRLADAVARAEALAPTDPPPAVPTDTPTDPSGTIVVDIDDGCADAKE